MSVRRLSEITAPGSISEVAPLDLDLFDLQEGDDITLLLTDIATEYGDVFVRAPSKTVGIIARPTAFAVASFVFIEATSSLNRLTITHTTATPTNVVAINNNYYTATEKQILWSIRNADYVKIGGPKLSVSFVSNHPGLGQGDDDITGGLVSCGTDTTGTHNPQLADIRANFKDTWASGVFFVGGSGGADMSVTARRYLQVNLAGVFNSSGISIPDGGVHNLWIDPDRTVVMDPFCRNLGWVGTVSKTEGGVPIGCYSQAKQEFRDPPMANVIDLLSLTGGVTFEYGTPNSNIFLVKNIGTSASDPFIVRFRDYGQSGPIEMTGLPSGVMVKKGITMGMMKHDPLPAFGHTSADFRWIRFQELPSRYRMGLYLDGVGDLDQEPGNNVTTAGWWLWFAEASGAAYETAYINVDVVTISDWAASVRLWHGFSASATDTSFGHSARASSGSRVQLVGEGMDRSTFHGPGSWKDIQLVPQEVASKGTVTPIDNVITDTRVYGSVTVGAGAENTIINNVDFTGDAARLILTIGDDASVALSDLSVRSGSTITRTGTGAATLDGSPLTFTANVYTFPGALTAATVTANGRPNAPSGGSVS